MEQQLGETEQLLILNSESDSEGLERALSENKLKFRKILSNAMSGEEIVQFAINLSPHLKDLTLVVIGAYIARGKSVKITIRGKEFEVSDEETLIEAIHSEAGKS